MFEKNLDLLQKMEVQNGIDHGLTDEEISVYAKPSYNYLQMKEMRTALEHGVEVRLVKRMKPHMCLKEMEHMRLCLEAGESVSFRLHIPRTDGRVIGLLLCVMMLFCAGFAKMREPVLTVRQDTVVLQKGEVFDSAKYVELSGLCRGELILPDNVNTEEPGTYLAVYTFRWGNSEISDAVKVIVNS